TTEARGSSTTTTVLESKSSEASAPTLRLSKRSMTDDLYTTFSSPVAWVLVLALIITWSAVAIIMFDLLDTKSLEAHTLYCEDPCLPPGKKNILPSGGMQHISKDPVKAVTDAMEESTDWMSAIMTFMTNLVAPEEEEEGIRHVDLNVFVH
uniref:Uncharacterized protein n=1 Tax=Astyanax mexicanus TaxID=7994 RepID=A0A3B1KES8_ASTMX